VVEGVTMADSIAKLGEFEADEVSLTKVATNLPAAQRIFNEAGWE
jgi:iron(III) transport system substrate-binding protein